MRAILVLLLIGVLPTMTAAHHTLHRNAFLDRGDPDQDVRSGQDSASSQSATSGQSAPASQRPDRAEVLEAVHDIIRAARYSALVTLDAEGRPQARAMDPFAPEDDLTVWMGTNRTTRKVEQLRRDPRATLYYFDPRELGYVTLLGEVEIVEDRGERRKRWKDQWADYYPGGPEGDTYLLLCFTPRRLEIVSPEHGIADEPLAWKPRIVELDVDPGDGR